MIPRVLLEWAMVLLSLIAAAALALTGDHRLGAYLLWAPGLTLGMLTAAWGGLFALAAGVRGAALVRCWIVGRGHDGVCAECPLAGVCWAQRCRPFSAAFSAFLWLALATSLASGDRFALVAWLALGVAVVNLFVFALLSSHAPWIKSYR